MAAFNASRCSGLGSASTISITPLIARRPSRLGARASMRPEMMRAASITAASTGSLTRASAVRLAVESDSEAVMVPRAKRACANGRTLASMASKPGGVRRRRSSALPLTERSSHAQRVSKAAPSARAKPVMLATGMGFSTCRTGIWQAGGTLARRAGADKAATAGRRLACQIVSRLLPAAQRSLRPRLGRARGGRGRSGRRHGAAPARGGPQVRPARLGARSRASAPRCGCAPPASRRTRGRRCRRRRSRVPWSAAGWRRPPARRGRDWRSAPAAGPSMT